MKTSVTNVGFSEGGAWPSSVRTVKRSVKSDSEQTLISIATRLSGTAHYRETAGVKPEEGGDRLVCPECPGLRALQNGTMGS